MKLEFLIQNMVQKPIITSLPVMTCAHESVSEYASGLASHYVAMHVSLCCWLCSYIDGEQDVTRQLAAGATHLSRLAGDG